MRRDADASKKVGGRVLFRHGDYDFCLCGRRHGAQEALDECARYDKLFSRTVEGSDIWRINHNHGSVQVSTETAEMLKDALTVSELSGGAFDPSVEPVTKLWDFSGETAVLPDAESLREAATRVDYTKLKIDGDTVTLPDGMGLDMGGIAKGFIADRLSAFLRKKGIQSALINLGGNVVTIGRRATDDVPWVVGIQDPKAENGVNKLTIRARIFPSSPAAIMSGFSS